MSYRPPTLFKKTSTGAIQEWTITTQENAIITTWGQVDGAKQTTTDVIKEGKNAGKKNATTPVQQAEAEALSQWEKKLKKGYVQTMKDAAAGRVDAIIEGGVSPMLAHKFSEQGEKIRFPAFAQPKFDGHRCIAVVADGKATLWTRTRKPITGLPHIVAALESKFRDVILDGELYNHAYKDRFEELSSFIRTPEAKPGHEIVQYHVYDWVNDQEDFAKRHQHIVGAWHTYRPAPCLVQVQTIEVADEDDMMAAFSDFRSQGYEGLMVRNASGSYVNKRSYDLQKVKEFDSAEFEVVGVEEGRGKLAGHAIFVCKTEAGDEFRAKLKGATEELKRFFENPGLAIGRQLEVNYQGITNKSGVPRFPVALRFRDDL
jgi:ATP-dependent DNA ligase